MIDSNGAYAWGPKPVVFAVGALVVVIAIAWALITPTQVDQVVAGFFAVVGAIATAAALMMRHRLTAGTHGLVVAGPLGRSTIAWSQITRIESVSRSRLGLSSTALEIDLDNDGLLIFGKTDLGADPEEVAGKLRGIRPA